MKTLQITQKSYYASLMFFFKSKFSVNMSDQLGENQENVLTSFCRFVFKSEFETGCIIEVAVCKTGGVIITLQQFTIV